MQPYTTDELIRHLQYFWAKAEGIDYGHEHYSEWMASVIIVTVAYSK
jgi:hypothetical protein